MKKLYASLLLAVLSVFSFVAAAKTVTVKIDPQYKADYIVVDGDFIDHNFDDEGKVVLNLGNYDSMEIKCAEGVTTQFYTDVTGHTSPTGDAFFGMDELKHGMTINVTPVTGGGVVVTPTWSITGNPEHVKLVDSSGKTYGAEENKYSEWKVPFSNDIYYYTVKALDGHAIVSVECSNGYGVNTTLYPERDGNVTLHTSRFGEAGTFVVNSKAINTDASIFILKVQDGDIDRVSLSTNSGKAITIKAAAAGADGQEVEFIETDLPLTAQHVTFGSKLALVEVEGAGNAQEQGSRWMIQALEDGDEVTIHVAVPDITAQVSVTVDNESVAAAEFLNAISYDGKTYNVQSFNELEGKKVGETVNFYFKPGYNVTVNANGKTSEITGQNTAYTYKIVDGDNNITLKATKIPLLNVTVKCENWQGITVASDYGFTEDVHALTGPVTTITTDPIYRYLYIKSDNYPLKSISTTPTANYIECSGSTGYITGVTEGMEVTIEAIKIDRDLTLTVYLEPISTWSSTALSSGAGLYTTLATGYNHVAVAKEDIATLSFEGCNYNNDYYRYMYVNHEKVYEGASSFDEVKAIRSIDPATDVLHIYGTAATAHEITYEIASYINAVVTHDKMFDVATPGSHSLLNGSVIYIKEVKEQEEAQALAAEALPPFQVKVVPADGSAHQIIEPDADGVYTITATQPMRIEVKDPNTGIENVGADDAAAPRSVYNLQGVLMYENADDAQLQSLPRGLYIVGGKKQLLK